MRIVTLLLIITLSVSSDAEDICRDWKKTIESDMQIPEAAFTKEAALEAHAELGKFIESSKFDWHQPLTSQQFIYGYLLKQRALKSIKQAKGVDPKSLHAVMQFCTFIVNDAYYND